MARLSFDGTEFKVFDVKLPEIEYRSLVYSSALSNNVFMRIWIFLSTSFENKILEPL